MPTSKLEKERKPLHYANVGKQIKEGRHVGFDFYDLLIEALIEGILSVTAIFRQLPTDCGMVVA